MRDLRMHWKGDVIGWVIDTDRGLSPTELERCVRFTLKVQTDRFVSLPPGDRKDECLRTIDALKARRVTVNIAGPGDRVLFDAYKSDGQKIFSMGG